MSLKTIVIKNFLKKKSSQNEIEFFFIANFLTKPQLKFLLNYWKHKFLSFCSVKCNFEKIYLKKSFNLNKKYDKSERNHVIITCSQKNLNLDNSAKNTKFKKSFSF